MRKVGAALVLALGAAVGGCERGSEEGVAPREVTGPPRPFGFTLRGAQVELVGELASAPDVAPPPGARTLRWVARDGAGHPIGAGELPDPRVSELEALGGLARAAHVNESGFFALPLAAPPASLQLFDGDRPVAALGAALAVREYAEPGSMPEGGAGVTKVVDHGDCGTAVNLLFMPEGFRDTEMPVFRERVATLMRELVEVEGFRQNVRRFDAWIAETPSAESGISDPPRTVKNTAWGVRYGAEERRAIFWGAAPPAGATILRWARARRASDADVTVVVVNATEALGATDRSRAVVFLASFAGAARGLAHELGHALLGLADEYDYGACQLDRAGAAPNTTTSPAAPPWSAIVKTPPVEGAEYCAKGVWKPTASCLMHDEGEDLCPVCAARLRRALDERGPACDAGPRDCSDGFTKCPGDRVCSFNGRGFCCRKPFVPRGSCTPQGCASGEVCAVADLAETERGCVKIDEGCE